VAYDVKSITEKLKASIQRGVKVRILLEESQELGGSISHDGAAILRRNIPGVSLYAWKNEAIEFKGGRVHAKMAIADDSVAFLTSANLTGYAMEKNIEPGILLNGGYQPHQISCHLDALIDMKSLVPV
jgi:cardiolipin synthase